MYLDLSELEEVFEGRWLWGTHRRAIAEFRRSDYLGRPDESLEDSVRDLVRSSTGRRPEGPIRLLTHLRYFGYCFNPVSFYYCFSGGDSRLETIVADITNTPWNEKHAYVLTDTDNLGSEHKRRFTFQKDFHISPFVGMDVTYDWFFNVPGEALSVHMANFENGSQTFDATLALHRKNITGKSLSSALLRFPLMTTKVTAAIYWNAFRLWLKGCPVYTHPDRKDFPEAQPR